MGWPQLWGGSKDTIYKTWDAAEDDYVLSRGTRQLSSGSTHSYPNADRPAAILGHWVVVSLSEPPAGAPGPPWSLPPQQPNPEQETERGGAEL